MSDSLWYLMIQKCKLQRKGQYKEVREKSTMSIPTQMKALHFDSKGLRLVYKPMPSANNDEALIKVNLAGICATDIELIKGYMDFSGVPGHEFAGEVVYSKRSEWIGKRVVGEINIYCNRCETCKAGLKKHCPNRKILGIYKKDGAFAEYLTLPVVNLYEIPEKLSDEEAIFIEPLAAACEFIDRVPINQSSKVAIIGDGKLAALLAQVLLTLTSRLTVLGHRDKRLNFFKDLGIEVKNTRGGDRLPEKEFDIVVESSGSPDGLPEAIKITRPRGTVILKSTYNDNLHWNPAQVVIDEITIIGSRCGPFDKAIELLSSGKINTKNLLSNIFSLNEWDKAFKQAMRDDVFKIALKP